VFSYLVDHGKLTETPLRSPPRRARYQRTPFIFDTTAAKQLLALAETLLSKGGTTERGSTYLALFAVLYGLGLRVGEACRLCIKDVDLERRLLLIRETKFYKSRLVPFGPKLEALLVRYLHQRLAAPAGAPADDQPLFCLRGGRPINPGTVSQTFHALVPRLHLQIPPGVSPPRLHDLRHSFAVGIPIKRTSLPDTHYLEREEVTALFRALPRDSRFALRDRTLLLFLYNTGARVQEVADLRVEHLELKPPAKVRLHGKGDKWRVCPLWDETVRYLQWLLAEQSTAANEPVFCARRSLPLTRFGIYKIVRRHAASWDTSGPQPRHVTPHLFRHTAAVHLLEAGYTTPNFNHSRDGTSGIRISLFQASQQASVMAS